MYMQRAISSTENISVGPFAGSGSFPGAPVLIVQAPEQLNRTEAKAFFNELRPLLEEERPRIVLDCSEIKNLDSAGVEVLLISMEEAMKRDGDVKLAAVSPSSAAILELMRVDRLFEIFETCEEAVRSFHSFPSYADPADNAWVPGVLGLEAAS